MIDVGAETDEMFSTDPGHGIGTLESRLPNFVEDAEVMSEEQFIGNIEIGLASHPGKVVVPARILAQRGIDDIAADLRRERPGQRLIAARTRCARCWERRCRRRPACRRRADSNRGRSRCCSAMPKLSVRAKLVIESGDAVIVVFGL